MFVPPSNTALKNSAILFLLFIFIFLAVGFSLSFRCMYVLQLRCSAEWKEKIGALAASKKHQTFDIERSIGERKTLLFFAEMNFPQK